MPSERINTAINGLIAHLVPDDPQEPEATAQERHDFCVDLVRSTVDKYGPSAVTADVNQAFDQIRKRLIAHNPNEALRFSNLYTRLLALPVLNQKWAILYLLSQLADSPDPKQPLPLAPLKQPIQRDVFRPAEKGRSSKVPTPVSRQEEEAFDDAFAPGGLKKFPPERATRGPDEAKQADDEEAAPPKRDVSLKSTLLAHNYVEIDPPETSLLRDLPFTLQGLNSTTLDFTKETVLKLPPTLPVPVISLLHSLAEPSLLYRGLSSFVNSPAKGLLGQSLRAAISGELRSYLRLVATLESQIRRALSSLDESAPRNGIGKAGVTLKRCVVWTREATMGLRLMSLIAEESKSRRGGQLISLIHSFSSSHGDPTVGAFAERLLAPVTKPFYDILRHWIYDGELSDPYKEFFVKEQDPQNQARQEAKEKGHSSVWNDKYEVDEAMIPSIIRADFAQKVFLIGKSLNFIRHSCSDSQWVEDYSKAASKELLYGDTATLEAWIDEAYKTTMKRLMHLMTQKFHLFRHLGALKKYILLGQGDFVALLMESLASTLDRPAGEQYRHNLTAQLDHAIRGSNAQFEPPEILRRLDSRMLQLSHGDIGWDCFTLEYKIGAPVDCVVTEWANKQYLKVFNFLFRVKRIEFALASTWHKCMTGARGVLQTADPAVLQTWKSTRGVLAEMVHFIGQLQYYILFEVIEASWETLQAGIAKEDCTLDDLIRAHTTYLTSITTKGLLGVQRRAFVEKRAEAAAHGIDAAEDRHSYRIQLHTLLHVMLKFRDSVDGLYSWAVSDFTQRQEADVRHSTRGRSPTKQQQQQQQQQQKRQQQPPPSSSRLPTTPAAANDTTADDPFGTADTTDAFSTGDRQQVESEFPLLQQRLRSLGRNFRQRVEMLLGDLQYQSDADMRFLAVAMNFNDVYKPLVSSKKPKPPSSSGSGIAAAAAANKGGVVGEASVTSSGFKGRGPVEGS